MFTMALAACDHVFHLGDSPHLWVFLSARAMAPGRFMFFNRARQVRGHRLFVATQAEDFYQLSFAALAEEVDRLIGAYALERVVYCGVSAGAFAALVLGCRPHPLVNDRLLQVRTVAFAPQFVLDQPLTIADRTLMPLLPGGVRVDPRYGDLRPHLEKSRTPVDLLLGAYEFCDGRAVSDALAMQNTFVTSHILRCKHDVARFCATQDLLDSILRAVEINVPLALPESILADARDIAFARKAYDLAKEMEHEGKTPPVPFVLDAGLRNPDWWNIKSRARARNGDLAGAMGDVMRALQLDPSGDGHCVCAGHYARDMGLLDVARAFYTRAAHLNPAGLGARQALAALDDHP